MNTTVKQIKQFKHLKLNNLYKLSYVSMAYSSINLENEIIHIYKNDIVLLVLLRTIIQDEFKLKLINFGCYNLTQNLFYNDSVDERIENSQNYFKSQYKKL